MRTPPPPHSYPRAKLWGAHPLEPADDAAVVRGAYLDALEKSFQSGPLGDALWQTGPPDLDFDAIREHGLESWFRGYGLRVFQEIALALFPEEYGTDPVAAAAIASLVSPAGGRRVGADRLRAFAAALLARPANTRDGDARP